MRWKEDMMGMILFPHTAETKIQCHEKNPFSNSSGWALL